MKTPERILATTDMSVYSLEGILYAQEISKLFNAEVVVYYVDEHRKKKPESGDPRIPDVDELKTRGHVSSFLINHGAAVKDMRIEIGYGPPATSIVNAAKRLHADLIVLSTHGRTGLQHILMGSVAEKVVRYASVPVLTVKPRDLVELVGITERDVEAELHLS
jgi:nucleotide-binding universal stress UspA family protein